uniref:Transmembrane protein n=1 Tax=Lotus japonicus TaxID=34305 RepID=I3SML7_LOTJA|nr:unknown [Lotus japonicus]
MSTDVSFQLFLVSSPSNAPSFLFFFSEETSFTAFKSFSLEDSCNFGCSALLSSLASSLGAVSTAAFASGTDLSAWTGCCFEARNARAFTLCFFPSACRRSACLLVAFVLQRLQNHGGRSDNPTLISTSGFCLLSLLGLAAALFTVLPWPFGPYFSASVMH